MPKQILILILTLIISLNTSYTFYNISDHQRVIDEYEADLQAIHDTLDTLGMIPGVGVIFDGVNASVYALHGDFGNAGLTALSALPLPTPSGGQVSKNLGGAAGDAGSAVVRAGNNATVIPGSVTNATTGRITITSNSGKVYDITPSANHSVISANNTPLQGTPNSSVDIVNGQGEVVTRRWFDSNGNQFRDVDLTNHGNARNHPEVPHEHPRRGRQ